MGEEVGREQPREEGHRLPGASSTSSDIAAPSRPRVGVVLPQTEIGSDPVLVREYAKTVEELGYDHLIAYDHVLGADPSGRPGGWPYPYTHADPFHEVFVLLTFVASVTTRLEVAPGVLVLPQRETALVAKQAATLDVLSGGRVRLGVGLGWNYVEFEALGMRFNDRGHRIEEQIEVLRLLWTHELVDYTGRWHRIDRAGIHPLPLQRPIPVWMGGYAESALRRIARIADGWFVPTRPVSGPLSTGRLRTVRTGRLFTPDDRGRALLERFRTYVRDAGRDPDAVGVEARVDATLGGIEAWAGAAEAFAAMGVTHLSFHTAGAGFVTVRDHLRAIRAFREAAVFG